MRDGFGAWLKAQGYPENTSGSRQSNVRTVERAYDETLDEIHARGGLRDLITQLTYSKSDQRRGLKNPSRIKIDGDIYNGLATLKGAVGLYSKFIGASWDEADSDDLGADLAVSDHISEVIEANLEAQRLSLETDLQSALRRDITSLEPDLKIIDRGAERAVLSGRIDILAQDAHGATVVIELKAGKTDPRVIGQVLGYMGDIAAEDEPASIRGIIVAHEFDARTRSAARAVPNLRLVRYAVSFSFEAED